MVRKQGKNSYKWHGNRNIADACRRLHQETIVAKQAKAAAAAAAAAALSPPTPLAEGEVAPAPVAPLPLPPVEQKPRREQSLGYLSKIFVKMFLNSETRVVSLQDAAKELVENDASGAAALAAARAAKAAQAGGVPNPNAKPIVIPDADSAKKSKVRRLYDIANVLTSLTFVNETTNESKSLIKKITLLPPRGSGVAYMWEGAGVYPLESTMSKEDWCLVSADSKSKKTPASPARRGRPIRASNASPSTKKPREPRAKRESKSKAKLKAIAEAKSKPAHVDTGDDDDVVKRTPSGSIISLLNAAEYITERRIEIPVAQPSIPVARTVPVSEDNNKSTKMLGIQHRPESPSPLYARNLLSLSGAQLSGEEGTPSPSPGPSLLTRLPSEVSVEGLSFDPQDKEEELISPYIRTTSQLSQMSDLEEMPESVDHMGFSQ